MNKVTWIISTEDMAQFMHAHNTWGEDVRDAIKFDQYADASTYAANITDRRTLVLKHVIMNAP